MRARGIAKYLLLSSRLHKRSRKKWDYACSGYHGFNTTIVEKGPFFQGTRSWLTKRHLRLSFLHVFHGHFILVTSPAFTRKHHPVPTRRCHHHFFHVQSFTGSTRDILTHFDIRDLHKGREGDILEIAIWTAVQTQDMFEKINVCVTLTHGNLL